MVVSKLSMVQLIMSSYKTEIVSQMQGGQTIISLDEFHVCFEKVFYCSLEVASHWCVGYCNLLGCWLGWGWDGRDGYLIGQPLPQQVVFIFFPLLLLRSLQHMVHPLLVVGRGRGHVYDIIGRMELRVCTIIQSLALVEYAHMQYHIKCIHIQFSSSKSTC